MARRSKKLSREEKEEVELWIYQNNTEESRITDTMRVNVKCKTENQKSLINSIKENKGYNKSFYGIVRDLQMTPDLVNLTKL